MRSSALRYLSYASVLTVVEIGSLFVCCGLAALIRYMVVPNVVWQQPLDLTFDTVCQGEIKALNNMCSFPEANFSLLSDDVSVLTFGQKYAIDVNLHLPDSESNRVSGMSILTLKLMNSNGNSIKTFRKPFSIPYRSKLVRLTKLLLLLPAHVLNLMDEELHLRVAVTSGFKHTHEEHISVGSVILESRKLQWTHATIDFNACLTGIQGILYRWPLFSSVIITLSLYGVLNGIYLLIAFYHATQRSKAMDAPQSIAASSDVPPPDPVRKQSEIPLAENS